MPRPLTLAAVGVVVLQDGVEFLYGQAGGPDRLRALAVTRHQVGPARGGCDGRPVDAAKFKQRGGLHHAPPRPTAYTRQDLPAPT
jgi:hypothetical protein